MALGSQFSVISYQHVPSGLQLADEGAQHAFDLYNLAFQ
jgi:hypothetical protein